MKIRTAVAGYLDSRSGVSNIEYGLIIALLAVTIIAMVSSVGVPLP